MKRMTLVLAGIAILLVVLFLFRSENGSLVKNVDKLSLGMNEQQLTEILGAPSPPIHDFSAIRVKQLGDSEVSLPNWTTWNDARMTLWAGFDGDGELIMVKVTRGLTRYESFRFWLGWTIYGRE